jgi:hypothetical protein
MLNKLGYLLVELNHVRLSVNEVLDLLPVEEQTLNLLGASTERTDELA